MTAPTAASNALLTEQLGWTPLSLIDDVINSVNELLYTSVESVESFVLSQSPDVLGFTPAPGTIPDTDGDGNVLFSQSEEDELQRGIHQLETLLETAVDRNFDGFELFVLRNILVVKEELVRWVQLSHHKGIYFPVPNTTEKDLPLPAVEVQLRLRTLRQKLLSSHNLNQAMQRESAANELTISRLKDLVTSTSTSTHSSDITPYSLLAGSKSTKDAAEFTTSQLGLIRSMVADLKPKYAALFSNFDDLDGTHSMSEGGRYSDDERKQYIEKMTRKYMEVTSGMRLNSRGEVVGGDFASEGARKSSEEVQRLGEIMAKIKGPG